MLQEIISKVEQKLEYDRCKTNFIIKPFGGYDMFTSKFIFSLNHDDVKEKFFVKSVLSPAFTDYLQNEARTILRLQNLGVCNIPSVVFCGFADSRYCIVQKFVPGVRAHASPSFLNNILSSVEDWTFSLQKLTHIGYIQPSYLIKRAEGYVEYVSEFFDLGDAVHYMERNVPEVPLPLCTIHGDLWHGNILASGKEIYFLDFAFSSEAEPPVDMIDFIVDYYPSLLSNSKELARYCSTLSPQKVEPIFLAFYSLLRRLAIKVDIAKKLYDQVLIFNLARVFSEIKEVGLIKKSLAKLNSSDKLRA